MGVIANKYKLWAVAKRKIATAHFFRLFEIFQSSPNNGTYKMLEFKCQNRVNCKTKRNFLVVFCPF